MDTATTARTAPRGLERALCVVAHPDDMEFGSAAAVARWTGQGKEVVYCMVTSGEAGIDGMRPRRVPARARGRGDRVGADRRRRRVEFLGLPDGILEYGVPLRRAIAAVVRRHRPEIVITGNFRETWGGRNLNQADHIATGRATLDAVRDAGNRWVFPEQLDRRAGAVGRREAGVGRRLAAPNARRRHHRHLRQGRGVAGRAPAYIEGLGWEDWDPAEFLEGVSRPVGSRMRWRTRTAFEVFSMTWGG